MWILLLWGEIFCIYQIGQVVNCVCQMFCILTDFSLFFFPPSIIEEGVSSAMNVDFSTFPFNFVKFHFTYFNLCFWIHITLGLGKARSHEYKEL